MRVAAIAGAGDGEVGGRDVGRLHGRGDARVLAARLLGRVVLALLLLLLLLAWRAAVGAVAVRALLAGASAVAVAAVLAVAALTAVAGITAVATLRAAASRSGGRVSGQTSGFLSSLASLLSLALLLVLLSRLGQLLALASAGQADTSSRSSTWREVLDRLSTRDLATAASAETVLETNVGRGHAGVGVGCAALVFALEHERRGGSAGARGTVGTGWLGGGLLRRSEGGGRRVGSGGSQHIIQGVLLRRLRAKSDVVQLVDVLVVHERTSDVVDADAVVDAETRARGGGKNVPAIRAPLAVGAVGGLDGADLVVVPLQIVDVDIASQVTKAGDEHKTAVGREVDGIPGAQIEAVLGNGTGVEDGGLGRHVAVDDTELFRVGRPRNVVDGTLLVELDARVKGTVGAEDVHVGLAVVALVGLVDVGLRQDDDAGAEVVPLELDLVALVEGLLRDGRVELGHLEDLDRGRHSLGCVSLAVDRV